ncbi:hypothetical protein PU02_0232 [Bartonella ancashensis]|uniref:Uncharacterized protein n=1 Tax=Bartonella ancashensis TaxID=1318743 RepID=A0A0M4L652_9HYPH|nr:hypothetical protein PU02_0232 [Bartonella ancashensis]
MEELLLILKCSFNKKSFDASPIPLYDINERSILKEREC